MIADPLTVPVLPAALPTSTKPPRYLTVPPDPESGKPPLRRIVRADGFPLGYVPPPKPAPEPAPPARLFDGTDGPRPPWMRPIAPAPHPPVRRPRQPKPPPDPGAPVFAPEQIKAARLELGNISQRDLAPLLGTNRGQLDGAEHGRRHLSPSSARALAALLARRRERAAR